MSDQSHDRRDHCTLERIVAERDRLRHETIQLQASLDRNHVWRVRMMDALQNSQNRGTDMTGFMPGGTL